jgi:serine phosphatase RsbU (regulator of sigma subunit)/ligand-binding sensor domain-containing protein
MKKTVFSVFIFWFFWGSLFPGSNTLRFKHISLDEGLSQNSVFCMIQDSKGFMWFGTQDGLNKYDGYHFIVYKLDPGNLNSLSHNQIAALCEDKAGKIWIGTVGGGVNRFDPKTETFFRYPVAPNEPASINNGFINVLYLDSSEALWIGTLGGGLSQLVREPGKKERFIHYRGISGDPDNAGGDFIGSIAADRTGAIWIGTLGDGLKRLDRRTKSFTHFRSRPNDPSSLSHISVSAILEDRSGMLWIGTNGGGLNLLLNKKTGECKRYRRISNDPGSLSDDNITVIYEDRSGILWIGTLNGGLNRFDKRTETFTRYIRDGNDPYSISYNWITSIYEDRSHILWVGTPGGGLNKFDRENKFAHYKADPNNPNSLSDNFVYAICEDHFGILWIGTTGQGLNKFDRSTGQFTHYRNRSNDSRSLSNNIIRAIYEDRQGGLWVGTNGGGLNKFNRETGTFSHYRRVNGEPDNISGNSIRTMYEDRAGVLWVGTIFNGLNRFNRETGTFKHYRNIPGNPNSLAGNYVTVIYEAPTEPGILWIGTYNGGVHRFDPQNETFRRYMANPGDTRSISSSRIQAIHRDHSGTLWVGTYGGGLNKVIRKKGEITGFIHYTEKNGLANNSIYGILEDEAGCLWISTNKGLSRFDPKRETFKNYNVRDGLQGNEFNGGAFFKSKSGEMFFGGLNGVNAFYPAGITDNPHVPPVVITGFNLFNKPAAVGGDSPLKTAISRAKEIRLSYNQNAFSFEFAALDFTIPGNNKYAYRMEGLEKEWNYRDSQKRFASYTNLDPGEYIFRVKGSNNDETWNVEGTSIRIIITPPFWQTWWFRFLLLFLLVVLIMLWYRGRLRNVRIKTELQTARDAQMSIMPQSDPVVEGFNISGICVPASEVGGDFFDYIWMNEEKTKLGIAIGDVSGKAMQSAMTAVMTSGMIYSKVDECQSVKEIVRRVNRPLYFKTEKTVFTALCLASLDVHSKELTFTNAGLTTPLLKSGGSISRLKGKGNKLPLGIRLDSVYLEKKQPLTPGDLLVFFTDGVTDAKNSMDEFYRLNSLVGLLEKMDTSGLTAKEIKDKIIADVERFSGGAPQHDDMTVVVIKVL